MLCYTINMINDKNMRRVLMLTLIKHGWQRGEGENWFYKNGYELFFNPLDFNNIELINNIKGLNVNFTLKQQPELWDTLNAHDLFN